MDINLPEVKGKIIFNADLSKYSWFQTGGKAEALFFPQDIDDLQYFLQNIKKDIPITVIGGGSNLLIRDGGIDGVVIILKNTFNTIEFNNNILKVDCGVLNSKLYNFAKNNEIANYEFLGTIPGTLGGAIRGNAGCYGSEIKDLLISIQAIDYEGNIHNFKQEDCNFEYRKNNLPTNLIFIRAYLKADSKDTKQNIENKFTEMMNKRITSQPQGVKTCGSTFKNPVEKPAWKIIQELGYQDKEINGVKMSEKHANFMINISTTSSKHLEELGNMIIKDAKEKQNINLEWEIKIIGKEE